MPLSGKIPACRAERTKGAQGGNSCDEEVGDKDIKKYHKVSGCFANNLQNKMTEDKNQNTDCWLQSFEPFAQDLVGISSFSIKVRL